MLTLSLPTPPKFKLTELKDKLPVIFTESLADDTPPSSPKPLRPKLRPEIISTNHHNFTDNKFLTPYSPRSLKRPLKGTNLFPMSLKPQPEILTAEDFADLDELVRDLENFGKGGLNGGSRLSFFVPDEKPLPRRAPTPPPKEPTPEQLEEQERRRVIGEKLKTFNIKKLTTKIYIENNSNHKVVQLTSLSTPLLVIEGFIQKGFLPADNTWTLFEINSGFRCERYLRDWEPIMEVLEGWEPESSNVLILRRYSKKLTNVINAIPSQPPIFSSAAYLEVKSGKWEKRHLFLKKSNLFIAKNNSPASASLLCSLSSFDAYNLIDARKKAPTQFSLGLKSQDSILMFENPERDYVHFLCFENKILLKNWSMAIYHARNMAMWEESPEDQCLFVPPKYQVDAHEITTLEFDQGQFPELDPNVPFKTRMRAQRQANSKLRFIKQLFGSGDKKSEMGSKPVSEVFKKGSLLDVAQPPGSNENAQGKNAETDKVFSSGSLLAKPGAQKDTRHIKIELPNNGPLVDASTPAPFQNGSLLDNAAQQQQQQQQQAKNVQPQRKAGPLVDASTPTPFQNGSLLDSSATQKDKHRTLQTGPMINIQSSSNFQPGSLLDKTPQKQKYSSMMPNHRPSPLNLSPPGASGASVEHKSPTSRQIPESPLTPTRSQTMNGTKYNKMAAPQSPRRTDSMPPQRRVVHDAQATAQDPISELNSVAARLRPAGGNVRTKFPPPGSSQLNAAENKFNVALRKVSTTPKDATLTNASVKIKKTEIGQGIKNNPFMLKFANQGAAGNDANDSGAPAKLVDIEKGKKSQFQSGSLLANGASASGAKKDTNQKPTHTQGSLLANMSTKPSAGKDTATSPDSKRMTQGGLIDQAGIKKASSGSEGGPLVQLDTK